MSERIICCLIDKLLLHFLTFGDITKTEYTTDNFIFKSWVQMAEFIRNKQRLRSTIASEVESAAQCGRLIYFFTLAGAVALGVVDTDIDKLS